MLSKKRIMDNRLAIFVSVLFCSSTVCMYTVHKLYVHAPSPLLSFWWISSTTYRPRIWTTACSVVFSGFVWTQNILEMMPRKAGGNKIVLVHVECGKSTCGKSHTNEDTHGESMLVFTGFDRWINFYISMLCCLLVCGGFGLLAVGIFRHFARVIKR